VRESELLAGIEWSLRRARREHLRLISGRRYQGIPGDDFRGLLVTDTGTDGLNRHEYAAIIDVPRECRA